ncbi:MAG: porin, partial [Pseudomonadota bacterium]
ESPDETVTSLSATYSSGPLSVAFANETWGEDTAEYEPDDDDSDEYDGNGNSTGNRLAVSYDLMPGLTLAGFYQSLTDNNDYDNDDNRRDNTVTGFGGQFKLDPQTYLRGHYFTRAMGEQDDADSSMMAVGVEHRLDSALRVYANYATVDNDDNASLTPWKQARTASPSGADGETATGISLGMRYDF